MKRGEVWMASLDPVRGSEQAGTRPVIVLQADSLNSFLRTALVIPCTSSLRWAEFPHCVRLASGEGGLTNESAVLTHQLRVIDATRLVRRMGVLSRGALRQIETALLVTLDISVSGEE